MQNAMTVDYEALARSVVAIRFPQTDRPALFRANYISNERQWTSMVKEGYKNRDIGAFLVKEDSEEGRAIVSGTSLKNAAITPEYLRSLDMESLSILAKKYEVKVSPKSTEKSITLGILRALEEEKNNSEGQD